MVGGTVDVVDVVVVASAVVVDALDVVEVVDEAVVVGVVPAVVDSGVVDSALVDSLELGGVVWSVLRLVDDDSEMSVVEVVSTVLVDTVPVVGFSVGVASR